MRTIIYYFSGTGNSLKVAQDLASEIKDAKLVRICMGTLAEDYASECVGFVFPVYYYGLPVMVKEFVDNLKVNKEAYIFAVATCGGTVGAAIQQLDKALDSRGLKLSAVFKIRMPDNYQVLYAPPSEKKQQACFADQEQKVKSIADHIKRRNKIEFQEKGKLVVTLGGLLYKTFKPKNMDKNFWADDQCYTCGICSKVCPSNNIQIIDGKPEWQHQCELCLACMQWCPQQSIQYKQGTLKRKRYHHPQIKVCELFNPPQS